MGTIASLLGQIGQEQPRPWDIAQRSLTQTETGLRELADLKRKQASEALLMERIQNDPELRQRLFGDGSVLGSLQTAPGGAAGAPGGPGAGPMTQQSFAPGQPPGAPQVVPGGQDLSQFATQGGPPQSTLASLGPQPGPQQPQRNPVMEMAARDPRAALILQQQMQTQQDRQMKMQEQGIQNRIKVVDYLARMAQGTSDQDSWKQFIEEADRVQPGAGGRLPQMYSKEARDRLVAQGLDAKETMTLQVQDLTAQAAVIRARKEGRSVDVDNQLRAMGVQPGQETPAQIKEALQAVEDAKVRVSASHGTGQIVKGPTGEYVRVNPRTDQVEVIKGPGGEPLREKPSETEQRGATLANSVAAANTLATELEKKGYKPNVWDKGLDKLPLGLGNYVTSADYQKYRQTVNEFASAWLYGVSGAQINDDEWERANQTFFPQPNEDKGAVELKRQRRAALVKQLEQQTAATGRTGTQGQPQGQAPTASSGKPVGQMSKEDLLAEKAAILARGGK